MNTNSKFKKKTKTFFIKNIENKKKSNFGVYPIFPTLLKNFFKFLQSVINFELFFLSLWETDLKCFEVTLKNYKSKYIVGKTAILIWTKRYIMKTAVFGINFKNWIKNEICCPIVHQRFFLPLYTMTPSFYIHWRYFLQPRIRTPAVVYIIGSRRPEIFKFLRQSDYTNRLFYKEKWG